MTSEERKKLIDEILIEGRLEGIEREQKEIKDMLQTILDAMAIRQKDACQVAGVAEKTAIRRSKSGELPYLQADGEKSKYFTLTVTRKLKERKVPVRR